MASHDWQLKMLRHLFVSVGDNSKQFELFQNIFGMIDSNKRPEWLIKILDSLPASERVQIVKWYFFCG
jgi:hypothetical protein